MEPICSSISHSVMSGPHSAAGQAPHSCWCSAELSRDKTAGGKTGVSWSLLTIRSVSIALIYTTSAEILHGSARFGLVLKPASGFSLRSASRLEVALGATCKPGWRKNWHLTADHWVVVSLKFVLKRASRNTSCCHKTVSLQG